MDSFSRHQLIGMVIGLADAVAVLLVVVVALSIWAVHQRRRMKASRSSELPDGHEHFSEYLHQQAKALAERYREHWDGNPPDLDRLRVLEQGNDPALVMLQLRYDLVRTELLALEGPTSEHWQAREEYLGTHLARWDKAEQALASALAQSWNASAGQSRSGTSPQPEPPASSDAYSEHNREVEMKRLRDRIDTLEGYRQRFNEMHSATVEERRASSNLRTALRKEFVDDSARGERVDAHLEAYEMARRPLDEYLDRGDIAPFEARPGVAQSQAEAPRNLARQQRLVERSGERLDSEYQHLLTSITEQRQVIDSLKTQLEKSELSREQLERHYTAKIRELEQQLAKWEQSLKLFENESHRNRRQIRKLMAQSQGFENQRMKIRALEETVDRFAAQAVTMQSRIDELEAEREALDITALTGDKRGDESSGEQQRGTGGDERHG